MEIGYLGDGDTRKQRDLVVELVLAGFDPVRRPGPYDFAASDLALRIRELGTSLSFEHGFWRAPPPHTLFLHRKLGGLFLLCARLRARVDVRRLLEPYLQ